MSRNAAAGFFGAAIIGVMGYAIFADGERSKPAGYDPAAVATFREHVATCDRGEITDADFCAAMRRDLEGLEAQRHSR